MSYSFIISSTLRQSRAEAVCSGILAYMKSIVNGLCGQSQVTREVSEIVGGREALAV